MASERARRLSVWITLGAVGIGILVWITFADTAWVVPLGQWIQGLGPWGPAIFAAVYATSVVLFVPGSLMTMVAGILFGIVEATIIVTIGAVIGCSASFLISRYLARDWVERRLASSPRYAAVDRVIGEQGFRLVFLLRLSPVFPFTPGNFLLGLTKVSFLDYTLASAGMIPGTVLYVYYGSVVGDLAALGSGAPAKGALDWTLLGLGLVLATVATWLVTRAARRALDEELGED
jgi:uncharacterized membrane protein YdjX (TVP38/TMEM64 family)